VPEVSSKPYRAKTNESHKKRPHRLVITGIGSDVLWAAKVLVPVTVIGVFFFFGGVFAIDWLFAKPLPSIEDLTKLDASDKALGLAVALSGAFAATLVARLAERAQGTANQVAEKNRNRIENQRVFNDMRRDIQKHQLVLQRIEEIFELAEKYARVELVRAYEKVKEDHQENYANLFNTAHKNFWAAVSDADAALVDGLKLSEKWEKSFGFSNRADTNAPLTCHVARTFGFFDCNIQDVEHASFHDLQARLRASFHDSHSYGDIEGVVKSAACKLINHELLKVGDDIRVHRVSLEKLFKTVERSVGEFNSAAAVFESECQGHLAAIQSQFEEFADVLKENSITEDEFRHDVIDSETREKLETIEEEIEAIRNSAVTDFDYFASIINGENIEQEESLADTGNAIEEARRTIASIGEICSASFADWLRKETVWARTSKGYSTRQSELKYLIAGMIVFPDASAVHGVMPYDKKKEYMYVNIGLAFLFDLARIYPVRYTNLNPGSAAQSFVPERFSRSEIEEYLGNPRANMGFRTSQILADSDLLTKALYWVIDAHQCPSLPITDPYCDFNKEQGWLVPDTSLNSGEKDIRA